MGLVDGCALYGVRCWKGDQLVYNLVCLAFRMRLSVALVHEDLGSMGWHEVLEVMVSLCITGPKIFNVRLRNVHRP